MTVFLRLHNKRLVRHRQRNIEQEDVVVFGVFVPKYSRLISYRHQKRRHDEYNLLPLQEIEEKYDLFS